MLEERLGNFYWVKARFNSYAGTKKASIILRLYF